jgi:hypothetical protein
MAVFWKQFPQLLSLVDRWAIGESWYTAEQVIVMLDGLGIDHA